MVLVNTNFKEIIKLWHKKWYKSGILAGTLIKWREKALSLFLMLNTDKLHSLYLYKLLGGDTGSGLQEKLNCNLSEKPLTEHKNTCFNM